MKFAILALFGLVAVQAVELPTSDELVELIPFEGRTFRNGTLRLPPLSYRRILRVEQDEEPVEKKRHGRKHRRADEDEMIEKKKRHGRKQRRVEQDEEPVEKKRHGRRQRRFEDLDELIEVFERANVNEKTKDEIDDLVKLFDRPDLNDK